MGKGADWGWHTMAELVGLREPGLAVYQLLCGEDVAVPAGGPGADGADEPMTTERLLALGASIGRDEESVMRLLHAINGDLEA